MKLLGSMMMVACMCCLVACGHHDADSQGQTPASGAGTCTDQLSKLSDLDKVQYVMGAMASYKAEHPGDSKPDDAMLKSYMDKYCLTHPMGKGT